MLTFGILAAMSGTGSKLLSNFSNPLKICMIYEADSASLDAAGSSVYGSVLVKVNTPLPGVAAEEEVVVLEEAVLVDKPHPADMLTKTNINASDKNSIFFKADLPFLF